MKPLRFLLYFICVFSSLMAAAQTVTLSVDKSYINASNQVTITATLSSSVSGTTVVNFAPTGDATTSDYTHVGTGNGVTVVGTGRSSGETVGWSSTSAIEESQGKMLMINVNLANPKDKEELALLLEGKKKEI